MGLAVFWSEFAKLKLEEIYQYYKLKASKKVAKKIINGIVDETIDLDKNPEIGQVESTLKDKTREFRYLVSSNYKIIRFPSFDSRITITELLVPKKDSLLVMIFAGSDVTIPEFTSHE